MLISTSCALAASFCPSIDSDVLECMECIFQRLRHNLHLGHGGRQQLVPVQTFERFVFSSFFVLKVRLVPLHSSPIRVLGTNKEMRTEIDAVRMEKILFERKQITRCILTGHTWLSFAIVLSRFLLGQTKCLAETELLSAQPASTSS